MSAAMTMPEQIDGLEKLLALANLKPENIIATQKAAREQLQLTQDQEAKVAEAKTYITKHESLSAELKNREDVLASSHIAHTKEKEEFATHVASENARLEEFSARLEAKEKAHIEIDKKHATESAVLANTKSENERQYQEAMALVQVAKSKNEADAKVNEAERNRLAEWEASLKRKAEIARQQMANF